MLGCSHPAKLACHRYILIIVMCFLWRTFVFAVFRLALQQRYVGDAIMNKTKGY